MKVVEFVLRSNVCPGTSKTDWMNTLISMHINKWLYVVRKNGKIVVVIGAYRVKEFNEESAEILPVKEEGHILYVPFVISMANDTFMLKRMLDDHLTKNPEIKELVFYERDSDVKFKRIPVERGKDNGKEKTSEDKRAGSRVPEFSGA